MSTPYDSIADIATKIKGPWSLAAMALLSAHISLYFIPGIPDGAKPWLLASTSVSAIIMLAILKPLADHRLLPTQSAVERQQSDLFDLIDASSVPMYITDSQLHIIKCNQALAEIVDTDIKKLLGLHLSELADRFALRVPSSRRDAFKSRQDGLINKTINDLAARIEDEEYIDNSDLLGNKYNGLYHVWAHADKIRDPINNESMRLFIFYHVRKAKKGERPPAVM